MNEEKPTAPGTDAAGTEPAEESGAGYGNHAPPAPTEEPGEPGKDAG